MKRLIILGGTIWLAAILGLAGTGVAAAKGSRPRPTPTPTATPAEPILLVHGYQGSPSEWATFQSWLTAAGRTGYAIDLTASENNVTNAAAIQTYVTARGWTRFQIVAWSMGGLAARYYLKNDGGAAKVDRIVLLGSPNYGVPLACFLPTNNGGQMCPSSSFLRALDAAPIEPGPTAYTTITSTTDGQVANTSSVLPAPATNLTVTGPTHDQLASDRGVFSLTVAALR